MKRRSMFVRCAALAVVLSTSSAALAQPAEAPPAADAAAQQGAVQRLFQIIKSEPTIKEVQNAALRYYKLEPSRINSMARSARLKGLMPEIEGSFDNMLGRTYTNMRDGLYPTLPSTPDNPNPDHYKERVRSDQDQLTWRVRAVFNLDRLVFNSEALDVRSLSSLGEALVREVTTLYFARRRLLASIILSPPADDQALFFELTRLDELTSTIDALTGGNFAKKAWQWETAK